MTVFLSQIKSVNVLISNLHSMSTTHFFLHAIRNIRICACESIHLYFLSCSSLSKVNSIRRIEMKNLTFILTSVYIMRSVSVLFVNNFVSISVQSIFYQLVSILINFQNNGQKIRNYVQSRSDKMF